MSWCCVLLSTSCLCLFPDPSSVYTCDVRLFIALDYGYRTSCFCSNYTVIVISDLTLIGLSSVTLLTLYLNNAAFSHLGETIDTHLTRNLQSVYLSLTSYSFFSFCLFIFASALPWPMGMLHFCWHHQVRQSNPIHDKAFLNFVAAVGWIVLVD